MIVGLVFVDVVYFWEIVRIINKCFRNDSVDSHSFALSIAIKTNYQISILIL